MAWVEKQVCMDHPKPVAKNRKLTLTQQSILKCVAGFRFVSAYTCGAFLGVSRRSASKSLNLLVDHGYVAKRYDTTYRLSHKRAHYCIDTRGMRYVKTLDMFSEAHIKALYADRKASDTFVYHSNKVFDIAIKLRDHGLSPDFRICSRSLLLGYDEFPTPKPDLYIAPTDSDDSNQSFIDIFDNETETWIIKKRIRQHVEHYDSGEWCYLDHPTVVIVLGEGSKAKNQLEKYALRQLDKSWIYDDEMTFIFTEPATLYAHLSGKHLVE